MRLYSRLGNDPTKRFPLIVEGDGRAAVLAIDGEAVACDDNGVPSFDLLRHRQRDDHVFLYVFDLIELGGEDLRRKPLEQRKVDLGRLLPDAAPGLVFNEWIDGGDFDCTTVLRCCSIALAMRLSGRRPRSCERESVCHTRNCGSSTSA